MFAQHVQILGSIPCTAKKQKQNTGQIIEKPDTLIKTGELRFDREATLRIYKQNG